MATRDHAALKQRQRAERDQYSSSLALRVHRALSWLDRAEREADPHSRFIFLWIAFNAAYASEIDDRWTLGEQDTFNQFLTKLHELDTPGRLEHLVWDTYAGSIRVLLNNRYVFAGFWDYQRGHKSRAQWEASFEAAKAAAGRAVGDRNTPKVLAIVLSRIYVLRNQLIHGGATWGGSVNRAQVRDCCHIMADLVPLVIEIMMDNPDTLWGEASFPVVAD